MNHRPLFKNLKRVSTENIGNSNYTILAAHHNNNYLHVVKAFEYEAFTILGKLYDSIELQRVVKDKAISVRN